MQCSEKGGRREPSPSQQLHVTKLATWMFGNSQNMWKDLCLTHVSDHASRLACAAFHHAPRSGASGKRPLCASPAAPRACSQLAALRMHGATVRGITDLKEPQQRGYEHLPQRGRQVQAAPPRRIARPHASLPEQSAPAA